MYLSFSFDFWQIDCEAVLSMDGSQLKEYIPEYGDRVSIVAFCRTMATTSMLSKENLV